MPQYQYIRIRRDSAANWATRNPILEDGEPGWDETLHQLKVGDGATHWNALVFQSADPAGTAATLVGIEATRALAAEGALSTAIATEVTRATAVEAQKADLVDGVIPSSQVPALQFVKVVSASSQAAMLAFTEAQAPLSTLCVRTDGAGTFILTAEPPSVLGNWTALPSPTDTVTSVNGHIGPVVLGYDNVGADPAGAAGAAQGAAEAYADGLVAPLATDALVVHKAGAETLTGTKTFTVAPTVPDGAWSIAKTSGLQSALDTLSGGLSGLAVVATTGSYTDLTNKPSIPAAPGAASTGTAGILPLATGTEATTGTNATKAITPATLKTVTDAQKTDANATYVRLSQYVTTTDNGDGTATVNGGITDNNDGTAVIAA